ncbi:hypothetical protein SAMN05660493_02104 [Epilithonimonas bovis DSM 19482]|uniref:Capsular polysaccharide synthesis protein n=1 Tax=Epilithonimonas bovis DSM 19482 TaxID=1121284 RepID=A0A1U7PXG7_9FLAO|nr:hypothetical protein [Epilithonimonas bovis]SIT97387.1 hypothetical protein SAMN05660493_02104 [Epilithonimonas bovis DSM 19482]
MLNKIALRIRKTCPETYQFLLNTKQGRYNYTFNKDKYPHSFLNLDNPVTYTGEPAPEVIYCFWTGDNPLTENRKKGIQALEKNAGVPVKLITPENLPQYIKPGFPLHKGYELLSLTMRSDYLRCYFMHHHGGGYADIKPFSHSWKPAFQKLNDKNDRYIIGYPELLYGGLAPVAHRFLDGKNYNNYELMALAERKIHNDLAKHTPLLIGNCAFICKPYTPITTEWYNEVNKRMDELYEYYNKDNSEGMVKPIPYFYLVQIFHPLILKYHKHIIQYKKLLPVLKNYR